MQHDFLKQNRSIFRVKGHDEVRNYWSTQCKSYIRMLNRLVLGNIRPADRNRCPSNNKGLAVNVFFDGILIFENR